MVPTFGNSLKLSPNYEFSLEQSTQKTESIQLTNPGTADRIATLEVINPHPDLITVTLPQPSPTIAAGETQTLPIVLSASATTPTGAYDDLLLKITVDDGSTLYASFKIYVTSAGAGQQPDLAITANGIRSTTNADGTLTLAADVRNSGLASAQNIQVQFYEFGNALGSPVAIDQLSSNGIGTVSITVSTLTAGDHLIRIVIDPTEAIAELDETNNEVSRLITIGSSVPTSGGILVTGSLPSTVYTNALFTLSGQAIYDLYVNGVRITDYVVKGGSVEVTITSPGVRESYGDVYTDVDGSFSKSLQGPSTPGLYDITLTVTDKTFSGTRNLKLSVIEAPATPADPPSPPPGTDGAFPVGDWTPSGGELIWVSINGPVPPSDLWVLSKNIYFSKNNPTVDEEITVFSEINYWASNTALLALNVPINIYATHVTSPATPKLKIGQTVIKNFSVGKPDFGSRYVYATWKNQGDGIYLIEFEIDPSYAETNRLNNAATRAIIAGQLSGSSQSVISGQVVDALGGVGNVMVHVLDTNGVQIGNAITNSTGFYLVSNVPLGALRVHIDTPNGYVPDAETKTVTTSNQVVSTVNFQLTSRPADTTPPVIAPTVTGTQGNNGWYKSDVTVSWTVTDPESAVNLKNGCEPKSITTDTLGITFTCSATSNGGTDEKLVTIKRDATLPTISGVATPAANANSWRNSSVTVNFNCSDVTAGIAICAQAQILNNDGANQSVNGTATDQAGNSATATVTSINIDRTPPIVSVTGVTDGARYSLGSVPTAECTTTDALSGVQTNATLSVTSGANGLGTFTASCTGAIDKAGNTGASTSATYQVYAVDSTPPVITPTINGSLGSNNWYTSVVTVSWTVMDSESAITSQSGCDTVTVATDTAGISLTCSATSGGGTASQALTIKRDATPPTVSVTGVADGATYIFGSVPTAGCTTADVLSGVKTDSSLSVVGGDTSGLGAFSVRCTGAMDNAGNIGATSVSYQVTSASSNTSFSNFSINSLLINQRLKSWVLLSNFTLGSDSNGIDPASEPVTFTIAGFTTTIPAGQFRRRYIGTYTFAGKINDVWIEALIAPLGNKRFGFQAGVYGANPSGTSNPVNVKLIIGNDQGSVSGNALIR